MRPRCPGTRTHRGKTLVSGCALEASLRGRTMTPRPPRSPAKMAAARAQSRRGGARTRKSPWAGPRGSRSWARCSRGVLSRRCAVGQGTGRPQPSRKPSDGCPLPPAPPSPSLRPCRAAWSSGNYSIPSLFSEWPKYVGTAPEPRRRDNLHFSLLCLSPAQKRVPSNLGKQQDPSPHRQHSTALLKLMFLTCSLPISPFYPFSYPVQSLIVNYLLFCFRFFELESWQGLEQT